MADRNGEDAERPRGFWAMILRYPAVPVAVIGVLSTLLTAAAPPIADVLYAREMQVPVESADLSRDLVKFFGLPDNASCPGTQADPMVLGDGTELSAILCASGDLVMIVDRPQRDGTMRRNFYPLLIDKVLAEIEVLNADMEREEARAGLAAGLLAAHARTRIGDAAEARRAPEGLRLAQAQVLWTEQVDARTLKRRLRDGNRCWDEYIDMPTGRVIRTEEVPC